MSYGLRIRDAANNLIFDSLTATGGVCLDIVVVAAGGATYTYPDIGPGLAGFSVTANGRTTSGYTYDSALGYPRFIFSAAYAGVTVAMFAK